MENKKYYKNINGLRALTCFGIVMLHVYNNGNFIINNSKLELSIIILHELVALFATISAFCSCNSHYQEIVENKFDVSKFYKAKYKRLLPLFLFLCLLDLVLNRNIKALIDTITNCTLIFGLFIKGKTDIETIGVGWFIGMIFVFYMIFPYFCFLLANKKRAWFSFTISIIIQYFAINVYGVERINIIYFMPYFLFGGIIYLYKKEIKNYIEKYANIFRLLLIIALYLYNVTIGPTEYMKIILYGLLLIYAISCKSCILGNEVSHIVGKYSMEIYLVHMVIYRFIALFNINILSSGNFFTLIADSMLITALSLLFAICFNLVIKRVSLLLIKKSRYNQ